MNIFICNICGCIHDHFIENDSHIINNLHETYSKKSVYEQKIIFARFHESITSEKDKYNVPEDVMQYLLKRS